MQSENFGRRCRKASLGQIEQMKVRLSFLCFLLSLEAVLSMEVWAESKFPSLSDSATLETPFLRFRLSPQEGRYEILDKKTQVTWYSNPYWPRFGEAVLNLKGKLQAVSLDRCDIRRLEGGLEAEFHPLSDQPALGLRVQIRSSRDGKTLEFSYEADNGLPIENIRLLEDALWVTDTDQGYLVVPVREGLLLPANSGLSFTYSFGTFDYEGCHMEMLGIVKKGSALLITWRSPYTTLFLKSVLTDQGGRKQILSPSLELRKTARSFQVQFLGRGDYVSIAKAYRQVAKKKGWLVRWSEKLKGNPERAKLFGAVNFKLWSTLSRTMNEESTREEAVRVNWTFDEAAQIAEHLKRDLKMDRVLFILGGWIHRGYDNQHPDILPAAPECGGNEGLARCAQRVRELGYLFCLHDNYQDMYRDAPSWDESFLMKRPDGGLALGGRWAGGRAYLTCSKKALELAQRPQNLPAVKALTNANAYFIDTTYASGLYECFDPRHPLTKEEDMKWKQALSDYARKVFGIFGSECGREWAIPHSDFFEGLTGVSGRYYHDAGLLSKLGGVVVPLFEIVYRDTIAMYGKYGYDLSQSAEYVLHHISIGRPLNYHSVPPHLYWKEPFQDPIPLALRPEPPQVTPQGPRQFRISYRWRVEKPLLADWHIFVHFTDSEGHIRFQGDYQPMPPTSRWAVGEVPQGPFTVSVPEGLTGIFDIRVGLYRPSTGERALLLGSHDGERRMIIGRLKVSPGRVELLPFPMVEGDQRDPALFLRADNGWAEGLHPLDRFIKNTYEILSPLNEITAQMPMSQHRFLSPDRKVQLTVFGQGPSAVEVIVNKGDKEYRYRSKTWGEVLLPPYGFFVEGPSFVAFYARSWNGLHYEDPPLFTLRSEDSEPLRCSRRIRVYHGFGDSRLKLGDTLYSVKREGIISR